MARNVVEELVEPEYAWPQVSAPAPSAPATEAFSSAPSPTQPTPVRLDIWLLISGLKPDQTVGFRRFALAQRLGPRTAPEWQQVYSEFLRRVV